MSLKVGIIGLANVGKSTLFNALVGQNKADVSDYPFCTIEPNKGIVEIPDGKLEKVAETLNLKSIINAPLEFVDIAGLIKGAHKGEGLGNEFLSHIQKVDLLCQVLPFYRADENPKEDKEIVMTELILKDLHQINKLLESGELSDEERELLDKVKTKLDNHTPIGKLKLEKGEKEALEQFSFLSAKKIFYVANIGETDLDNNNLDIEEGYLIISAKTESDLIELDFKEQKEYKEALSINTGALDKIIKKAFEMLNLISFYTIKLENNQIQAWPIKKGTTAKKAAGLIHSDFEEKFIQAQVIASGKLLQAGSLKEAGNQGFIKAKGENYIIKNQEIINFKHG